MSFQETVLVQPWSLSSQLEEEPKQPERKFHIFFVHCNITYGAFTVEILSMKNCNISYLLIIATKITVAELGSAMMNPPAKRHDLKWFYSLKNMICCKLGPASCCLAVSGQCVIRLERQL